jgi:hypothetical protein
MTKKTHDRFAETVARWVQDKGTPPPAIVFELHPAFEPLAEAIRIESRRARDFRGMKKFHHEWCKTEAIYFLQELARDGNPLTAGGETTQDVTEILAESEKIRLDTGQKKQRNRILPTGSDPRSASYYSLRVLAALLDDVPPDTTVSLRAAWDAVRACPAPDLCDWREPESEPYDYLAEVRARHAELKARRARNA